MRARRVFCVSENGGDSPTKKNGMFTNHQWDIIWYHWNVYHWMVGYIYIYIIMGFPYISVISPWDIYIYTHSTLYNQACDILGYENNTMTQKCVSPAWQLTLHRSRLPWL